MFFIFSKILAFIISPVNWVVFALLYGWMTLNKQRKRKAYITAVILFFVFTNGFLAHQAMRMVEVDSIGRSDISKTYKAGILLGGMIHLQSDTNQVNFNSNADRLFQTLELYKTGAIENILISSGSGLLQLQSFKESYLIKKYLLRIGVPDEDIWIETHSRNTYENATETKKILDEKFGTGSREEFLLITSASHMRRSKGCFKKQGINVIPYSTTKRASRGPFVFNSEMILPDPKALQYWKTISHETIGYAVYKLSGKL